MSYRYIGRTYASMDLGPRDDTVTLRRDMRNATGGILFAALGIASPAAGHMSDLEAVPNPVIHSCQILDPGRRRDRRLRGHRPSAGRVRACDVHRPRQGRSVPGRRRGARRRRRDGRRPDVAARRGRRRPGDHGRFVPIPSRQEGIASPGVGRLACRRFDHAAGSGTSLSGASQTCMSALRSSLAAISTLDPDRGTDKCPKRSG